MIKLGDMVVDALDGKVGVVISLDNGRPILLIKTPSGGWTNVWHLKVPEPGRFKVLANFHPHLLT